MRRISKDDAKAKGYATFNGYDHVCVDIDKAVTLSLNLPMGKRVTFCVMPKANCIDIKKHDTEEISNQMIHFTNGKQERTKSALSTILF